MSERVEQLLRDYPRMKQEMAQLQYEIANFEGVTEEEIIDSMLFFQSEGERVQTSTISKPTENIALNYKDRLERVNSDWYRHLSKKYVALAEEVRFLEGAIRGLPAKKGEVMTALVIDNLSWDDAAACCYINRRTVGKIRQKAIEELEVIFQQHDLEQNKFLLS